MRLTVVAVIGAALALGACASGTRSEFGYEDRLTATPVGFPDVRFTIETEQAARALVTQVRTGVETGPDGRLDLLALSGGGANGAFAAGVINGWTDSGQRPDFEIVTGVSTGALAAPFVFLGPEWDDELRRAYTDGGTTDLLRSRGLGALFGSGVFSGGPLRELVETHVDQALLDAVAVEHRRGRILLVATTDLDSQRGVIWNMGAIADQGGLGALPLFRDVLIASASIPGVFPPVMIAADGADGVFEELHVDGGVMTPFIALPEIMWSWDDVGATFAGARIHVIVNGKESSGFSITQDAPVPVLARSLDAMLKSAVRTHLAATRAFAVRNGLEYRAVAIPEEVDVGRGFDFSVETMQTIYDHGYRIGLTGEGWDETD